LHDQHEITIDKLSGDIHVISEIGIMSSFSVDVDIDCLVFVIDAVFDDYLTEFEECIVKYFNE
jgi:hypothetical protein